MDQFAGNSVVQFRRLSRIGRLSRPDCVSIQAKRVVLAILAVTAALVGVWASIAPAGFYASFPLPGHPWVSALGPYNEHLTRDVGDLYLALLVVSGWAVLRGTPELLRLAGVAWLVFGVPHLIYHVRHLDMFTTADRVGNVVALGGTVLLATLPVLPTRFGRS